jgi:transcriptional regulator with XRE-family HTH domain
MMKWQDVKRDWAKNPKRRDAIAREFPYRKIADELVALRAGAGLTQADLAKRMNTTQSTVARFESGRHAVTVKTLDRVAMCLKVQWRIEFEPIETAAVTLIPNASMTLANQANVAKIPAAKPSAGNTSYALAA